MPIQPFWHRRPAKLACYLLLVVPMLSGGLPSSPAAARMATGIVAAGRVAAPPPPAQTVCLPPAPAKPEKRKEFWKRMSRDLDRSSRILAVTAMTAGLAPEPIITKGTAAALAVYAAGLYWLSGEANAWSEDPPDRHFTTIASPVVHLVRPVAVGPGMTRSEVSALNALMFNFAWAGAYTGAMTTAVNRATGASDAGSTIWLNRQDGAVAQDATRLARLVRTQPALTARLQQAVFAAGVQLTVSPAGVGQEQQTSAFRQVEQVVIATLRQLGVPPGSAGRMTANLLKSAVPSRISFPDVLNNPQLSNDAAQSAAGLEQFAAALCPASAAGSPTPSASPTAPTAPTLTLTLNGFTVHTNLKTGQHTPADDEITAKNNQTLQGAASVNGPLPPGCLLVVWYPTPATTLVQSTTGGSFEIKDEPPGLVGRNGVAAYIIAKPGATCQDGGQANIFITWQQP
jgi:hypothetical protein